MLTALSIQGWTLVSSGCVSSPITYHRPQVQDDYLDAYGDPAVIGKIGTDIEDNKCSWMICTVLQHASEEQKEVVKVGRHVVCHSDDRLIHHEVHISWHDGYMLRDATHIQNQQP